MQLSTNDIVTKPKGFIPTPSDFMTIRELTDEGEWPLDYIPVKGLIPYLKRKGSARGIEIGTARGESTCLILESCSGMVMTTIDPFLEYDDWIGKLEQDTMDKFKVIAQTNFSLYPDRAFLINDKAENVSDY